jgi:RNA-binding protein YlmH
MNLGQLAGEEKALLARLDDLRAQAEKGSRPRFTSFLNERQALIAEEYIRQSGARGSLFGGYTGAARTVAGFFPPWDEPGGGAFPVKALTLRYPRDADITHRDVLGSLMSLRLTRESIGDILCGEGQCILITLESVAPVILTELTKVGSAGVRCHEGATDTPEIAERYEEISGTVPSLRLDCLVKLATGKAREKSAALIEAALVSLGHAVTENISRPFAEGDVLAIRGHGKFRVAAITGPTKKGRLHVTLHKYV